MFGNLEAIARKADFSRESVCGSSPPIPIIKDGRKMFAAAFKTPLKHSCGPQVQELRLLPGHTRGVCKPDKFLTKFRMLQGTSAGLQRGGTQ